MGVSRFSSTTPVTFPDVRFLIDEGTNPGGVVTYCDTNTNLLLVEIDNSLNTTAVYLKLWNVNAAASVTLGTDPPAMQLICPATSTMTYTFTSAGTVGNSVVFDTGICYTILTLPGTSGTGADADEGLPEAVATLKMMGETQ